MKKSCSGSFVFRLFRWTNFTSHMDFKLFQIDVKVTILNGYIMEEVYVE